MFHDILGLYVVEVDVDTDTLGTFTGEVTRVGSAWATALMKARLGMSASGLRLGMASEGTFGSHPATPFVPSDSELLVFVDDDLGIVVGETEVRLGVPAIAVELGADGPDGEHLRLAGFPEHGLIVRPVGASSTIVKGIHDVETLQRAVATCVDASPSRLARVENDFRAMHHPTRREVIAAVAERLARRLATSCPDCGTPGWGVVESERGAPCSACRWPTRIVGHDVFGCARCDARELVARPAATGVDPVNCPMCNP